MSTILSSSGITKTYGVGSNQVTALKPVDLTIEKGEFVAVVGPSGSGKSTLLHLLAGLDKPSGGKVFLDGEDIYALPEKQLAMLRRRKIGFIFQFYNLLPILSAEENVLVPLLLDGQKVNHAYVDELFGLLGLEERRKHLPSALSGGQQQRVAIARSLINSPSVIFADEPTGNLDTHTSGEVLKVLQDANRRFTQTLIIITHDPKVASFADRVLTLVDGEISYQ